MNHSVERRFPMLQEIAEEICYYPPITQLAPQRCVNVQDPYIISIERSTVLPPESKGVPLSLDHWAEYIFTWCHRSSANPIIGVALDEYGNVDRRSTFAHMIINAICPFEEEARRAFVSVLATIAVRPHFYHRAIEEWNTLEYGPTFNPLSDCPTGMVTFYRPRLTQDQVAHMVEEDVIAILIQNRIPPSWIDHFYTWGYLVLFNVINRTRGWPEPLDALEQERRRRVCIYGDPPAIAEFDGWWEPRYEQRLRRFQVSSRSCRARREAWKPEVRYLGHELTPFDMPGIAKGFGRSLSQEQREDFISMVDLRFPSSSNYHELEHWDILSRRLFYKQQPNPQLMIEAAGSQFDQQGKEA